MDEKLKQAFHSQIEKEPFASRFGMKLLEIRDGYSKVENRGMNAHYGAHQVAGSGHTPPAITQPNVQISRTSPFGGPGGERSFRVRDNVMKIKNNYDKRSLAGISGRSQELTRKLKN